MAAALLAPMKNRLITSSIDSQGKELPEMFNEIGNLHGRIVEELKAGHEIPDEVLVNLGMAREDGGGLTRMKRKVRQIYESGFSILPAPKDPGVFYVYKNPPDSKGAYSVNTDRPAMVIKAGAKRATTELLVRKLAVKLGFQDFAVPGMFIALENPDFSAWGKVGDDHCASVELWNGWLKEIDQDGVKSDSCIMGILEPYIQGENKFKNFETYVKFVIFALALNIRDLRKDNVIGGVVIDSEECLPSRSPSVTPQDLFRAISALDLGASAEAKELERYADTTLPVTHMPIIDLGEYNKVIPIELQDALVGIVGAWNIDEIISYAREESIHFYDLALERLEPPKELKEETVDPDDVFGSSDEEELEYNYQTDQGRCRANLTPMTDHDFLFEKRSVNKKCRNTLTELQLAAFKERLVKLQKILDSDAELTVQSIVERLDGLYGRHYAEFLKDPARLRGQSPHHLVGRTLPGQKGTTSPRRTVSADYLASLAKFEAERVGRSSLTENS